MQAAWGNGEAWLNIQACIFYKMKLLHPVWNYDKGDMVNICGLLATDVGQFGVNELECISIKKHMLQ